MHEAMLGAMPDSVADAKHVLTHARDALTNASPPVISPLTVSSAKQGVSRPSTIKYKRRAVFIRDDFTCQLCGLRPADDEIPDPYTDVVAVAARVFGPRHIVTVTHREVLGLPAADPRPHTPDVVRGRPRHLDNLQTLCEPCNREKSDRLL